MNIAIPIIIILAVCLLECLKNRKEHFVIGQQFDSGLNEQAPVKSQAFPVDKPLMRSYWGPYMWGWSDKAFYDYGPQSSIPYPYAFECDDYANGACKKSCDHFCYKKHYMKCAAGNALVDPEAGRCGKPCFPF